MCEKLTQLGYLRVSTVSEVGQLAQRGGIVDLFPPDQDRPLRFEFIGDQLRSIRVFDTSHQRSQAALSQINIIPAKELVLREDELPQAAQGLYDHLLGTGASSHEIDVVVRNVLTNRIRPGMEIFYPVLYGGERSTFFDFLKSKNTVFLFPEPLDRCLDSYEATLEGLEKLFVNDKESGRLVLGPEEHFLKLENLREALQKRQALSEFGDARVEQGVLATVYQTPSASSLLQLERKEGGPLEAFCAYAEDAQENSQTLVLLTSDEEHLTRASALLGTKGLSHKKDPLALSQIASGKSLGPVCTLPWDN